jgi:hypothetical protein
VRILPLCYFPPRPSGLVRVYGGRGRSRDARAEALATLVLGRARRKVLPPPVSHRVARVVCVRVVSCRVAYLADKTSAGGVLVRPVRQEDGHFRTHRELAPASVAREPTRQRVAVPQEVEVALVTLQTLRPHTRSHTAAHAYQHTHTHTTRHAREAMVSRWVGTSRAQGAWQSSPTAEVTNRSCSCGEILRLSGRYAQCRLSAKSNLHQTQVHYCKLRACRVVCVVRLIAVRLCACGVYVFFL